MLTRREQLLVRPWQQRRYNNHRRKVLTALPAIDASCPPERGHVCCKLKKMQAEQERRVRIEQDNIRLLQRMRYIARTSRVDDRWTEPPPNFLQRVGVYRLRPPPAPEPVPEYGTPPPGRRGRCAACNPALVTANPSASTFPAASTITLDEDALPNKPPSTPFPCEQLPHLYSKSPRTSTGNDSLQVQRITLTQGSLRLSVNFPSHSGVSIHRGRQRRLLQREYCECSARTT